MILSLLLLATAPAEAGQLKVAQWSASSNAPATDARNYEVTNLGDGKQGTAWAEGEDGAGLGSWVMADFGEARTVTTLTVWASHWYNVEYFGHYARPKTVVAEYANGTSEEFTLQDEQRPQLLKLKSPVSTQTVKLRIKAIYSGKGVDTGISEIKFFDASPGETTTAATVTASSVAASDADGSYIAGNASDGIVDSMWCEGNKASDGTGEWLDLALGGSQTVSAVKLRSGASTMDLFKAVNRPTTATLRFGDGSTESITLKDMLFEQTFPFSARTTDRVKVSFTGVKKGEKYDDMCVSEITFVR
jgi:hypothetical protein